jgi:hypothetical protein
MAGTALQGEWIMDGLLTAIMTKTTGSALSTDVGGRIYLDDAPDGSTFPYVTFQIISGNPDDSFQEKVDEFIFQFSLFSASSGAAEITDMYNDLRTLFDDCTLTISGVTFASMQRQSLTTMIEEITVTDATQRVRHWAVEYLVRVANL